MSQTPRAPSVSQLFAIADHRASPQAVGQPFQAQPGQSAGQWPFVGQLPPHFAIVPAGTPANRGITGEAPPPSAPATTTGFQVRSIPGPGNSLIPVPTGIYDTARGHLVPSVAAAPVPPSPPSYIAELRRGNVGINCVWKEPALRMLAEFESELLRVTEEKWRAYWKVWVDLREPETEARDELQKRRFVARQLRSHTWYNGDQSVLEAMAAIGKIDEVFSAFVVRRREEAQRAIVNRVHPGVAAILFPEAAKDKMKIDSEADTRFRAHIEEAGDE